jgi:hypothetical protein
MCQKKKDYENKYNYEHGHRADVGIAPKVGLDDNGSFRLANLLFGVARPVAHLWRLQGLRAVEFSKAIRADDMLLPNMGSFQRPNRPVTVFALFHFTTPFSRTRDTPRDNG